MARAIDADKIEYYDDEQGFEIAYKVDVDALPTLTPPNEPLTPCDVCKFSPPSSSDGKPCCMCPAERRPPNEPLTLEQLREMDGEPVWIVDVGPHKWYGPGWAIVDRDNCLVRTAKNWNPVFFERYGERWLAYRRPPEGDCEIKDYTETCEECRFCDNTPASPPEGE